MLNEEKYDAILYVVSPVQEAAGDTRTMTPPQSSKNPAWGPKTGYLDYYGPDIYGAFSFGNSVKRAVQDSDTSVEVADFGPWISVRVTKTYAPTGKSATKTFLIVFQDKAKGIVMSTSNKWRTIDGWAQAVSYIRSASSALASGLTSPL